MSSGPCERLKLAAPPSGWFCGRLKDSWIGAWRWLLVAVVPCFCFKTRSDAPLGNRRRRRSCSCRREKRQSSRRSGPSSRASIAAARSFARGLPWRRSALQSHPGGLLAHCRKQRRRGRAGKSRVGRSAKKGEGASWGGSEGTCYGCAGRRGLLWVLWTPWKVGWCRSCWYWFCCSCCGCWLRGRALEYYLMAHECEGLLLLSSGGQGCAHGVQTGCIHLYTHMPMCLHISVCTRYPGPPAPTH